MTQPTYKCGHPRTRENTSGTIRPECKHCKYARDHARYQFKCGHPITPENVRLHGKDKKFRRCRTCDNLRQQQVNERVRAEKQRAASRPVVVVSPFAELYRAEKARRAERETPAMSAAKTEFQRQLDAQRAAGKGGRPKGSARTLNPNRPQIFAQRCAPGDELIQALGHFSGSA